MTGFCLVGAGRIGAIHARNIVNLPGCRLEHVVDAVEEAAAAMAGQYGAHASSLAVALADPRVEAVVVASSTDTHTDIVLAAAAAGKAVFCEKPLDFDLQCARDCLRQVEASGCLLSVGFNRRFDPDFVALHRRLASGEIGAPELVVITSRDPEPPPVSYIRRSGGMILDLSIHDLDMACWLLQEMPCEVHAVGSCLVDPAIGGAGDIDTAAITLKTPSGRLCQINNSRRAVYGYDQRIEVLGPGGMLRAENRGATRVEYFASGRVETDPPLHFFLQRYEEAYREELADFLAAIREPRAPRVTGRDAVRAQTLAVAAQQSLETGLVQSIPPEE